jgi:hypothetical protein
MVESTLINRDLSHSLSFASGISTDVNYSMRCMEKRKKKKNWQRNANFNEPYRRIPDSLTAQIQQRLKKCVTNLVRLQICTS